MRKMQMKRTGPQPRVLVLPSPCVLRAVLDTPSRPAGSARARGPWTGAGAALALVSLLALSFGCAGAPRGGAPNWREEGLASWYGADFHGRRTANGEVYDMFGISAAHKTLPLGTQVTVTRRDTGKRLRVRVNDRGPFVAGRIIDLSYGAARRLGCVEDGVVPVLVEAELSATALRGTFAVQVGAFTVEANARRRAEGLRKTYRNVRVVEFRDNRVTWWRVRVGGYGDEEEAASAVAAFAELGQAGFVVRED